MIKKIEVPEILFEDYYIIVINKPAGLLSENDAFENPSAEGWVKRHLQLLHPKNKNIFTGLPHRLDRPVSGVMLFAKTKSALTNLNDQFSKGLVVKKYIALAENIPEKKRDRLVHFHKKNAMQKRADISARPVAGYTKCSLEYTVDEVLSDNTVKIKIDLHTGKYHQIRAQLSFIGCPVIGDKLYGSVKKYEENKICLHAFSLEFFHPKTGEPMHIITEEIF